MFNYRDLVLISLVAQHGSISSTARALGLTQSYISKQLSRIETAWGGRLFDRTGRGVVLSDFGRDIIPEIEGVMDSINAFERSIKHRSDVVAGDVHVGIVSSLAESLIPRLCADITHQAPEIKLIIHEGLTGHIDAEMESCNLDVAILNRYSDRVGEHEAVLGHLDTMLIGKPDRAIMQQHAVPFDQIHTVPLVLPPWPDVLRVFLKHQFSARSLKADIKFEANTIAALKKIAATGLAYTLLPSIAVEGEIRSGTLHAVPIFGPTIRRSITLSLCHRKPLSQAARFVSNRLKILAMELTHPSS